MVQAPVLALLEVKGLKGAKAAQLLPAMEIARPIALPTKRAQLQIKSTAAAADYPRGRLRGLPQEQFRVLYLKGRASTSSSVLPWTNLSPSAYRYER
jgi:DNA repair protein RadC